MTSLIALAVVSPLIYLSEDAEVTFFEDVMKGQMSFFEVVQADFVRTQESTAQDDVLRMIEASHVNLTHVFANMLWDDVLSPLVTQVQSIPVEHCRTQTASQEMVRAEAQLAIQKTCFAKVGQLIKSLPRFEKLDTTVRTTMRNSSVFKIKVFDLRGLTVYSSELNQIGEDKSNNQGWRTAASGQSASELTHRQRFSAFEGVVEDRDLISSYIPILASNNKVLGIFEIYSDATPFLKAIKDTSVKLARNSSNNRKLAEVVASKNLERLELNNHYSQMIGAGLLALLYGMLLMIVRNGQRILDLQAQERSQVNERERLLHREKMTLLSTMAANVSHEVGNPLATISSLAEDIEAEKIRHECTICQPKMILKQTERIVKMTRQIVNFAMIRGDVFEPVDVNQMVKEVCDFLSFDHRFRAMHIEIKLGDRLPARVVISDHLNEALMSLVQGCLEINLKKRVLEHRILVETEARDGDVLIRIVFDSTPCDQASALINGPVDSRIELARRRLMDMGGKISSLHGMIEITLPTATALTD